MRSHPARPALIIAGGSGAGRRADRSYVRHARGQENCGSHHLTSTHTHHHWKILSPAAKRRAVDMLKVTLSMSERLACKAVGLARSTYRLLPLAQTPADPDAEMRAWLRAYARTYPCHGFRRAWAALGYDERCEVNKKRIHRLWREEGLQVKVRSPGKRAGVSSVPAVQADAPNVVWAIDFQFDSTTDGKAIKICLDDRRTYPVLADEPRGALNHRRAPCGPPKVLRMDNGPELGSQALQRFCENKMTDLETAFTRAGGTPLPAR